MVDAVSLALAVPGVIDLCLKYGERFAAACATYKHAEREVRDRATVSEAAWFIVRRKLYFLRKEHDGLDLEMEDHLVTMISDLRAKFDNLGSKLESLFDEETTSLEGPSESQKRLRRFRYVRKKRSLDQAMQDFENWQKVFEATWTLFLANYSKRSPPHSGSQSSWSRLTGPESSFTKRMIQVLEPGTVDKIPVFLPENKSRAVKKIPFSQAADDRVDYIFEPIFVDPDTDTTARKREIRSLAVKLEVVDPMHFGILQCKGVMESHSAAGRPTLDWVYRRPKEFGSCSGSLRHLIRTAVKHSLSERLRLAQQLARAVSYVHALDFVHKNIRPESLLVFNHSNAALGFLFLVGFDRSREVRGFSRRFQTSSWHEDLYHHPHRQGTHPEETYIMQHDIYSLGVCLLELGLWKSFLDYIVDDSEPSLGAILKKEQEKFRELDPASAKEALVGLARRELPPVMGTRYSDVVISCLTCLDDDNADFSDTTHLNDRSGVVIGVKYVEKSWSEYLYNSRKESGEVRLSKEQEEKEVLSETLAKATIPE